MCPRTDTVTPSASLLEAADVSNVDGENCCFLPPAGAVLAEVADCDLGLDSPGKAYQWGSVEHAR